MAGEFDGFSVVLKPHIGVKMSALGPVEIEHDQWFVLVKSQDMTQFAGFMTKTPRAPVRWIPFRGEAVSEYGIKLVEHVEKLAGVERDKALGIVPDEATSGYSE